MQRTSLWPASWLPAVDKRRGSEPVEVQRVWVIYDDRLQFMAGLDALILDESLDAGDVSRALLVWSSAAETALADAYRFAVGPVLARGLIIGRGTARMRLFRPCINSERFLPVHLSHRMCNQFTLHREFRIDTRRTNFEQKTVGILHFCGSNEQGT